MSQAIIVYLSTSGSTKMMAEGILDGLQQRKIDAKAVSFYDVDMEDLKTADAIIVGSSTFHYKMLPPMEKFIDEKLANADINGKIGAAFGSYGWSGEAPIIIAESMRKLGVNIVDPVLRIQHKPTDKDIKECQRLGMDIAELLKNQ